MVIKLSKVFLKVIYCDRIDIIGRVFSSLVDVILLYSETLSGINPVVLIVSV